MLIDTRSPKEYLHGHIPGAVNIPLLNDEHRRIVGITYKEQGREAAVLKGFELVGPYFGDFIKQVSALSPGKSVLLYCWRGGMRSNIMSWILGLAGYKVHLLQDGYKSFRNWVLLQCAEPRKVIVLGGKTGSGKTEVLKHLVNRGEQVIDLEAMAHHKGSSFGGLGQGPQPTFEQFENELALAWYRLDKDKVVWLENESRSIGHVKIPDPIYSLMLNSPLVMMEVPTDIRAQRILHEYGQFSRAELAECTVRLHKRLGGLDTQLALSALEINDLGTWLGILLRYYDKTYLHGISSSKIENKFTLNFERSETHADFSERLLVYSREILLNIQYERI